MSATYRGHFKINLPVSRQQHFYGLNHLHYLTTSTVPTISGYDQRSEAFSECIGIWRLSSLSWNGTSTYRRARLFDCDRFKRNFITTLGDLRIELGFRIVGYVLMPEHGHLLLWPSELANPSQIMQQLEERTAQFILKNLRQNLQFPWCQRMLDRVKLPATVHDHAHFRVWQRRFYGMNIWSEKKRLEKLN